MAIPSSGAISLTTIQTEFGGSNPISLNEYYAGGAYVPAGTTGTYGAVPSSGAISLRNFYGTSAPSVAFNDFYAYAYSAGTLATAGYLIKSNGYIAENINGAVTQLDQWAFPTSSASLFEVFATITSGTLSAGSAATGSWLAVTSDIQWFRNRTTAGVVTVVLSISVRKIGTTTVLDTWTVTLEAEAQP